MQDESRVYLSRVGIINFETGLYALYGSEINGDGWACTCSNTGAGTVANHAASITISGGLFSSGNPIGVECDNNSHVHLGTGAVSGNTTGVKATLMGQVACGATTISGNTQGCLANSAGFISDSDVNYANNTGNINYNMSVDGTFRANTSDFIGNVGISGALSVDTFTGTAAYITGAFSTVYSADAKCAIYATSGGGGAYPFNAFGHLVLQSRGNSGRDVCISGGGIIIANFTANGTVGIGVSAPAATLDVNGAIKSKAYTVATLPSAATSGVGTRAFVSDATATTFNSVVAGGGSNTVPVFADGTGVWRIG